MVKNRQTLEMTHPITEMILRAIAKSPVCNVPYTDQLLTYLLAYLMI